MHNVTITIVDPQRPFYPQLAKLPGGVPIVDWQKQLALIIQSKPIASGGKQHG